LTAVAMLPRLQVGTSAPEEAAPAIDAQPLKREWPLTALLLLFPLWWVLGLSTFIFPILAVPMAARLWRRRPVVLPPGFGIWLVFMASLLVSTALLAIDAPQTLPGTVQGRLLGAALRFLQYAAVTVILVYAVNLTSREMPQARLVRLLGWLFLVTVAGGYLGMLLPTFELTSPVEVLLPPHVRNNIFVQSLVHPAAAQLQEVFGYSTPRPAAPFGYTNTWGNNLSILAPWFVVGFMLLRGVRHRWLAALMVVLALVPAVYSLNRALWIGLAVSTVYVLVRNAMAGRLLGVGVVVLAASALLVVALATPLASVFNQRLDNGHSDNVRLFTTEQTLAVVAHSPILGFGGPRASIGSSQSIAVGKSPSCQRCGNPTLGSNGQLWLVLISQGVIGLASWCAFLLYGCWRYWRDRSAIGYAGVLVLLLSFVYMLFYNALVSPLCFSFLAYALLVRNEWARTGHLPRGMGRRAGVAA
jgi:hypothetical protein